jgi:hypothetical protein
VGPEQGVVFEQVDFLFPAVELPNSDWGRISADADTLSASTGISRGYLNVYTNAGWVIDNLLVDVNGANPITAYFSLGLTNPEDVSELSAHAEFSSSPLSTFNDGDRSVFPVGIAQWNAQGFGEENVTDIGPAPPPRSVPGPVIYRMMLASEDDEECVQSDVENVQTAVNQCVPMAVANSLQFLENSMGIVVPHDHKIGLKGDDSLVGQLDEKMDRSVPDPNDRTLGSGLYVIEWFEGKFDYLVDIGLTDKLEHKHQGRGFGSISDGDIEHNGITSEDNGTTVTWEFICDEICKGEDVELAYRHSTGGHAVRVVGCGTTEGDNWIMYAHDRNQSNDTDGLETVQADVEDLDNDGILNLGSQSREIIFVLSESVINEPPICDADGPYMAECAGPTTSVSLDGTGSYDPDLDDALTYSWSTDCPGGSFDDYTSVTPLLAVDSSPGCLIDCSAFLTVADNFGQSDSCSAAVTIIDSLDPDISCPADLTVEQTSADGTPVDLGDPTASDICDADPEVMNDAPVVFPLGETIVTWTATDDCSNSSPCIQTVVVVDTTPPEIHSVSASPNKLWPPNHQMIPVTVACVCEDICDIAPVCTITSVESSQPVNDTGDGDTAPDWEITSDLSVDLRAERSGNIKEGRIYTITVECTDFSGNSSTATVNVIVPHDKGKKSYQTQYYNSVTYYGLSPYNTASQNTRIAPVQEIGILSTLSVNLNNVNTNISVNNNNVPNMVVLKHNQGNNVSNSNQAKAKVSFNYNNFLQSNPLAHAPGNFNAFDLFKQQRFFSGNNKLSLGNLLGNHWGWDQNPFKLKTNPIFGFSLDFSNLSLSIPSNIGFKGYPFQ